MIQIVITVGIYLALLAAYWYYLSLLQGRAATRAFSEMKNYFAKEVYEKETLLPAPEQEEYFLTEEGERIAHSGDPEHRCVLDPDEYREQYYLRYGWLKGDMSQDSNARYWYNENAVLRAITSGIVDF